MITISKFSGKCDLYDCLDIHQYTEDELKNNVKIYVGYDKEIPLEINAYRDLIPYYPYTISISYFNNVERKSIIYLSKESFVDREEREFLESKLERALKIYNQCKKKHIPFDQETAMQEIDPYNLNYDTCLKLLNRVETFGEKATISGLHLSMHEKYRMELVTEMIVNGLNPAKYGYRRFLKGNYDAEDC